MTKLRLAPPIRFSSVPDIDRTAMNWAQLVIDQIQKWSNSIDGTNITTGSIPLSDLTGAAWNAYTPTWSGGGTAPVLNNGTIVGRWQQVGHLVTVTVLLTMGSTTTFGTSFWTISLPLTGVQNGSFIGGSAMAFDSSAVANYGGCSLLFSNSVIPSTITSNAALYSPITNYAAAVPFTWETGDTLGLNLAYESF